MQHRQPPSDLLPSLHLAQSIIEHAAEAIVVLDGRGLVMSANEAACRLGGLDRSLVLGRPFTEFVNGLPPEQWAAELSELSAGTWRAFECDVTFAGPGERRLEVGVTRIGEDGDTTLVCFITDVTAERQARRELTQSEERWRLLVEASPDAVVIVDPDGTCRWASPRAFQLFAAQPGSRAMGFAVMDWIAPEDRELSAAVMTDVMRGADSPGHEFTGLRADGTRFRVEVHSSLLHDDHGRPDGMLSTLRDVDSRYRTLTRLATLADISRIFLRTAPLDGVFAAVPEILRERFRLGAAAVELFDGNDVVIAGVTGVAGVAPGRRVAVDDSPARRTLVDGGPVVDLEGGPLWAAQDGSQGSPGVKTFVSVPITGEQGVIGALSLADTRRLDDAESLVDVLSIVADYLALEIERRRSADALRVSERKYRVFLEHFHGVAYRRAPGGPIGEIMEGAVTDLTGYAADDFASGRLSWFQLVHPQDLPRVRQAAELLTSLPDYRLSEEYRIVRRDGQVRWVSDVARRIDDDPRGPVAQGAVYDITEQKASQARIAASEEKLRRVFNSTHDGIVVHDELGRVREVNETFLHMYGVPAERADTYTIQDYSAPDAEMLARLPGALGRDAGRPSAALRMAGAAPARRHVCSTSRLISVR